jgi:acyl-CoA synthetase (AMP-forming)/AMP-acid ligase II
VLRSSVPALREVVAIEDLLENSRPLDPGKLAMGPNDPALIQYTSGSTGEPKGVLLSHENLLTNIRAIGAALSIEPSDVGVSWLPLYHDMGLIGAWLTPMFFGIPVAIFSPIAFLTRPEKWLWTIHRRRGTISPAPNFAYELAVRKIAESGSRDSI